MNKKIRIILAIMLCIVMVFALVACEGPKGEKGPAGDDGDPGTPGAAGVGIDSISLSQDGTKVKITLKLTDGTSKDVEFTVTNGTPGTPGTPGANGLTPWVGSNGNWWTGADEATGTDLKVPATGNDGVGIESIELDPAKSDDEKSVYVVKFTDDSIPAFEFEVLNGVNGAPGTPGIDGVGIASIELDSAKSNAEKSVYVITFTDGGIPPFEFEVLNGTTGAPGANGLTPWVGSNGNWWIGADEATGTDTGKTSRGEKGDTGADGISIIGITTELNGDGELLLMIKLSNDEVIPVAIPTGEDGTIGPQGPKGEDGRSVVSIEKTGSEEGFDIYTITYSSAPLTSTFRVAVGTTGEDGNGIDHIEFVGKESGVSTYKIYYTDGRTPFEYTVIDGAKGDPGDSGRGIKSIVLDTDKSTSEKSVYTVNFTDDSEPSEIEVLHGAKGDPGDPGKSAYQIWLDKGYEGTEDDFLEWLKGTPGKSAYDIWLDQGHTGSEEDFLEWLKGEPGPGTPGVIGITSISVNVQKSTDTYIVYTFTYTNGLKIDVREYLEATEPQEIVPVITDEFDYYAQTYGVQPGHVFRTIAYPDLRELVSSYKRNEGANNTITVSGSGKYAILFGGAWDSYTKAMMQTVNASAKALGIETVWVMDTYYDGKISGSIYNEGLGTLTADDVHAVLKETEIGVTTNNTGYSLSQFIGLFAAPSEARPGYPATVLRSNGQSAQGAAANSAMLFVIDLPYAEASRTAANNLRPVIVDYFQNKFLVNTTALKAGVDRVLGNIKKDQEGHFDSFEMRPGAANLNKIPGRTVTKNVYFQAVSYAEFLAMLGSPGDHMFIFGSFDCPNFRALVHPLYEEALNADYKGKIYWFDATTIGTKNSTMGANIRSGTNGTYRIGVLFAYLFDNYLNGFESKWNGGADVVNHHRAIVERESGARYNNFGGKAYTRLCVPAVALYNNEAYCSNEASPSASGTSSKGGIVDIHESEINYGSATGSGDATANPNSRSGRHVRHAFARMFEKYGVVEKLIEAGYTVDCTRNNEQNNTRIMATGLPPVAGADEGTNAVTTSGTMDKSGFGLDVTITATKGDEKITLIYSYFKDGADVDASAATLTGGNKTEITTFYKDGGNNAAALMVSLAEFTPKQSGNLVYHGTAAAIALLESIILP